jgi:glutamyl-tRNA synthetase
MQITHVIRGEEWLSSTPLHVLLYRAFGWEEQRPKFAHLPLILKPEGTGKLSKRDGDKFPQFPLEWTDAEGKTFKGFRELGYLPEALINFLALLGWNPGHDEEVMDINRLIEAFSIERIGKSGTKFDLQKATWFNEVYLRNKPDTELLPEFNETLKKAGIFSFPEEYLIKVISLLKDRISFENELFSFGKYFFITPEEYDAEMVAKHWNPDHKGWLKQYHDVLDQVTDWNAEEIENALKKLAETLGMKSGKMMPVLRLVFTGVSFGPAAIQIAETIGKPETLKRITQVLNRLP